MFDISRKGQYKDYYWMIGKCNIALYRAKKLNTRISVTTHFLVQTPPAYCKNALGLDIINIILQVSHSPRKNDLAALTSKLTLSILSPKTIITVCFRNKQRMCKSSVWNLEFLSQFLLSLAGWQETSKVVKISNTTW